MTSRTMILDKCRNCQYHEEDIDFIVKDLRASITIIAGNIAVTDDSKTQFTIRVSITIIAGSIAEMNEKKNRLRLKQKARRKRNESN